MGSATALRALEFSLEHLQESRPLMLGIQGPQGSGKSYLAEQLQRILSSPPHDLRVVQLSLDDLYLPHPALQAFAASHADNPLLQGRGLPGTHDIELGRRVLTSLAAGRTTDLPIYDKSAHSGAGDRSQTTVHVEGKQDIVILEGWMLGFLPLASSQELRQTFDGLDADVAARRHALDCIAEINSMLTAYQRDLWSVLDVMIALRPIDRRLPWKWRLEQEHAMKAKNGGRGMSDEQVEAFVDRYAPAYDLWDFQLPSHAGRQSWQDHVLVIELDEKRRAINTG